MTLIELLVSATSLLLLLGMVVLSLVSLTRACARFSEDRPRPKSVVFALESLARQVRSATGVQAPDEKKLQAGFRPTPQEPLILTVGSQTVAYCYDSAAGCLQRTPLGGATERLGDASGFAVTYDPGLRQLRLRLEAGTRLPFETVAKLAAPLGAGDL